jgi:hypothetical protein
MWYIILGSHFKTIVVRYLKKNVNGYKKTIWKYKLNGVNKK